MKIEVIADNTRPNELLYSEFLTKPGIYQKVDGRGVFIIVTETHGKWLIVDNGCWPLNDKDWISSTVKFYKYNKPISITFTP